MAITTSTLGSPGIEVREKDNSIRPESSTSTAIFVPGFATQGPVEEVHAIGSMTDFENVYGTPTNAAERYFYYSAKAMIEGTGNGARIYTSRLPYGPGRGDTVSSAYTLLAYPAVPVIKNPKSKVPYDCYIQKSEDDNKTAFENLFKIKKVGSDAISAKSCDYTIIIDEDFEEEIFGNNETKEIKIDAIDLISITNNTTSRGKLPKVGGDESYAYTPTLYTDSLLDSNGKNPKLKDSHAGYISTEFTDKKLYVNFAFNIIANNGEKVGMFVARAEYEGISSSDDVTSYEFDNEYSNALDVKFELVKANKIAYTYDGQESETSSEDSTTFTDDITYLIGAPVTFQISHEDYYKIITGEDFKWSRIPYNHEYNTSDELEDKANAKLINESTKIDAYSDARFGLYEAINHSAFIVINKSRGVINDSFEGYYLGICDNMFINPSDDYKYNAIKNVKVTTNVYNHTKSNGIGLMESYESTSSFDRLGESRLSFQLENDYNGSVSKIMERNITPMDISSTEFDDTLNFGLFKLSKSTTSNDALKLNYSLREKYNASIGRSRIMSEPSATRSVSYFVENIIEDSTNITILVNPNIADKKFVDVDGVLHGKTRIFGTKLVENIDKFEKKYVIKSFNNSLTTDRSTGKLMDAYKLAKNSIKSYADIVAQAGVTPGFIKRTFSIAAGHNTDTNYKSFVMNDSLYPFGVYSSVRNTSKIIGNLPAKITRALDLIRNDEEYEKMDLLIEAGLGTIYAYSNGNTVAGEGADIATITGDDNSYDNLTEEEKKDAAKQIYFDDTLVLRGIEDLRTGRSSLSDEAESVAHDYLEVQNAFYAFCNSQVNGGRGDSYFISDVPRGILIKGKDTKVSSLFGSNLENSAYESGDNVKHSWSTSIYYPIKHVFDTITTTYGSTYAQWLKVLDNFSGEKVWLPASPYVAARIASADISSGPWSAPAGIHRGVISGVLDCAISPTQTQRTDLYKICINSIPKLPNSGVTIMGIRTMSKKSSAFDQITCRRTFLYMENVIKRYMRNYVFEPNTSYTRLLILNDVEPFLETVRNNGGIYNYVAVCDTSNNTPEIINNGDLALDISAAPVRTGENIIINFSAEKYTSDISATESQQ